MRWPLVGEPNLTSQDMLTIHLVLSQDKEYEVSKAGTLKYLVFFDFLMSSLENTTYKISEGLSASQICFGGQILYPHCYAYLKCGMKSCH
jgi:hypothetical protein